MDACFHLKGKNISSWSADPSIQDGWVYFTKWGGSEGYGEFVKTLGQQQEVRSLVAAQAARAGG
jgi:hypothetical protein